MSAYIIAGVKTCFLGKSNQVDYSAHHHIDNFFTKRRKPQNKKADRKHDPDDELIVGTSGFEFARRALLERGHQEGTSIEDHEVGRMLDVTAAAYCISHALPVPRKGTKAMGVRLAREDAKPSQASNQQAKAASPSFSAAGDPRTNHSDGSQLLDEEEIEFLEHQRALVLRAMKSRAHSASPLPSSGWDKTPSVGKRSSVYSSDLSALPPRRNPRPGLRRNAPRMEQRLYWDELHPDDSVSKISRT